MINRKESYYPSNYTLNVIDSFGCKPMHSKCGSRKFQGVQSQSKIPQFARKHKKTFDKEQLLQQVREEKLRYQMVSYSRSVLGKSVSRSKIKVVRGETALLVRQRQTSYSVTLKREMQQLVGMIQKQSLQIEQIKTSKKYNRILELSILKEAYQEEMRELKSKMRSYRHQIRERKRVRREQRKRNRQIRLMNQAVEQQIDSQNIQITQQIQTICGQLEAARAKQRKDRRQRERLLREIYQLQERTGVVYIIRQQKKAVLNGPELERVELCGKQEMNELVQESQQQSSGDSVSESFQSFEQSAERLNQSF